MKEAILTIEKSACSVFKWERQEVICVFIACILRLKNEEKVLENLIQNKRKKTLAL